MDDSSRGNEITAPHSAETDSGHDPRFATVIAPVDGSKAAERTLPLAARVARIEGAPLVLVRVVPYPEPPPGAPLHGSSRVCLADPPPEIADACTEATAYLDRLAATYAGTMTVHRQVLTGDPFTRIVTEISRWPHPLAVLSAHAANVPSSGDRSELARRIASLPGIHVLIVPHEDEAGSPRALPVGH